MYYSVSDISFSFLIITFLIINPPQQADDIDPIAHQILPGLIIIIPKDIPIANRLIPKISRKVLFFHHLNQVLILFLLIYLPIFQLENHNMNDFYIYIDRHEVEKAILLL